MFHFKTFSNADWMGYTGAEAFADGGDPLISSGDFVVDGAPAEIVVDSLGLSMIWVVDDVPYIATAQGADATRVLVMLRPTMTYAELEALRGIEVQPL